MRKLFLFISLLCCIASISQEHGNRQLYRALLKTAGGPVNPCPVPPCPTVPLSFGAINPLTDFKRPGGNQQWQFNSGCQVVPISFGPPRVDYDPTSAYRRFFWSDMEGPTQGSYKFNTSPSGHTTIREAMTEAANNNRLFAFGVATLYPDPDFGGFVTIYDYDGFLSMYPEYVHDGMQASGASDFDDGESWLPNYNHPVYLGRYQAMWTALKGWFDTAFIRPTSGAKAGQAIPAMNILDYIDIRGYGSYGEWHHCCQGDGYNVIAKWISDQPGRFGTVATMKQIVDIHVNTFNTTKTVAIINTMDAGWQWGSGGPVGFQNTQIPAEVGIYILLKSNLAGPVGLRRDQVGNNENYYHEILENNDMTFGGSLPAKNYIMTRYQTAYFVGEPQGGPPFDCPNINMGCAPGQVRLYHMYSFGNGNYGGCGGTPTDGGTGGADSIRASFRIAGARIKMNDGTMTATLQQNATFNVTINWQNIGVATEQRAWNTVYELRNGANNAVWTSTIPFTVKGMLPGITTTNNNLTLPLNVPVGTYRLVVRVVDPTNYLPVYPLGNTGRESDGAYQIRAGITVVAGS